MFLSLPELQKERGFPHPSRKKKLLKLKRESTRWGVSGVRDAEVRYLLPGTRDPAPTALSASPCFLFASPIARRTASDHRASLGNSPTFT